jgi:NADH:ubiquinone oxidoreductase subunit K
VSDVEILFVGAFAVVGIGLYGLLVIRNLIKAVVALQILVKGVLLALAAAGEATGQKNLVQSMAMTVIVADTVVAVIGLALAVQIKRVKGTLDLKKLSDLRG